MPRSSAEAITDEERTDRDRDGESNEGANCTNAENCADSDIAGEDEEDAEAANEDVEPDCVDGGLGIGVHTSPEAAEWKAAVSGVGERDSTSCNHASLTH